MNKKFLPTCVSMVHQSPWHISLNVYERPHTILSTLSLSLDWFYRICLSRNSPSPTSSPRTVPRQRGPEYREGQRDNRSPSSTGTVIVEVGWDDFSWEERVSKIVVKIPVKSSTRLATWLEISYIIRLTCPDPGFGQVLGSSGPSLKCQVLMTKQTNTKRRYDCRGVPEWREVSSVLT